MDQFFLAKNEFYKIINYIFILLSEVCNNVANTSNNLRNKITGDLTVTQAIKLLNHSMSEIDSQP